MKSDVVKFVSVVRLQKGLFETGKVTSRQLLPLVGRKVEVSVKEVV